ncbi:MAG: L,D-transpeptidase [Anaerolineales bacterium]
MSKNSVSRRDFLKLTGIGLAGLFVNPKSGNYNQLRDQQGRVIYDTVQAFDIPSLNGNITHQYWSDTIVPITEVTIGDAEPSYNRVWYRIGDIGYAHSGGIQPVKTIPQAPIAAIPESGQLAEVSVPYTDARWRPDFNRSAVYRFYYETTHWVTGLVYDDNSRPWYRILDDKWDLILYVQAEHLRLIPDQELQTISPNVPEDAKRLEVRTSDQIVIAYEWDRPVFMARAATGAEFSTGKFFTPHGRHFTFHKRPSRHMAAGNLAHNGYDLPGVPWICYITEKGVAFHGTYWHNDYGRPRSHGCINLTPQAAKWIYRWTLPVVPAHEQRTYELYGGTKVDVF